VGKASPPPKYYYVVWAEVRNFSQVPLLLADALGFRGSCPTIQLRLSRGGRVRPQNLRRPLAPPGVRAPTRRAHSGSTRGHSGALPWSLRRDEGTSTCGPGGRPVATRQPPFFLTITMPVPHPQAPAAPLRAPPFLHKPEQKKFDTRKSDKI